MEILRFWISLVVGFLGLVAAVLGVVADVKRVKIDDIGLDSNGMCSYPTSPSEALGIVAGITFIVAFSTLMAGAALSGRHITTTDSFGNISCTYVKPGLFAGGAVFAILTVLCAIVYYLLTVEVKKNPIKGGPTQNQNIAMAQPQPPLYSGQP
eukprot:PITA_12300